jgi:hypothetical protein
MKLTMSIETRTCGDFQINKEVTRIDSYLWQGT